MTLLRAWIDGRPGATATEAADARRRGAVAVDTLVAPGRGGDPIDSDRNREEGCAHAVERTDTTGAFGARNETAPAVPARIPRAEALATGNAGRTAGETAREGRRP